MKDQVQKYTPFEVGVLLLAIITVASLISLGISYASEALGDYAVFFSYGITPIIILVAVGIYILAIKRDRDIFSLFAKPNLPSLGLSVVAGVGVLALLMIANYVAIYVAQALDYQMGVSYPPLNNAWQWILTVLCVCALPAIAEEILFRGLIREAFRPYGDVTAIIVSSVLFALFHFNPAQSVYPMLYGMILGLVVAKTGKLYYAMIMHGVNNLVTVIITYCGWVEGLESFSWQGIGVLCAIALSGMAVFYTAYAFILKLNGESKLSKKDLSGVLDARAFNYGSLFTIVTFAVIYICVIIGSVVGV